MARARNIKPGFFINEDLAECSPWARLCFIGLWMLADREGRLQDRPKRIKGELFPYESFEVEPLLQELARYGFIDRYEVNGVRVIAIPTFSEHQNPHKNEKPSELPARHDENREITGQVQYKHSTNPADSLNPDSLNPDCLNPDCLNPDCLNPDSLNPDCLNPDCLNPDSLNPESTTGASPVVPRAHAHATPPPVSPVDNFAEPPGLASPSVDNLPAEPPDKPPAQPAESKPDKPPGKALSPSKARHGIRLPDDWQLPKDWGDWALGERQDLSAEDVRREAACFADYWHAKAGVDARKSDWQATWRNWIRRAHGKPRSNPPAIAQSGTADSWIRPESLQAREVARQRLFGVVINAAK